MDRFQALVQGVAKCIIVLTLYVLWDRICGAVVTKLWQFLKEQYLQINAGAYAWQFGSISISWGLISGSTRVEIRKFRWFNPKGFRTYEYFLDIKRMELVVDAASAVRFFVLGRKQPICVEYIEAEGVTVNLERRRDELNLWAALGLTEEEAQNTIKQAYEQWSAEDFDETGEEEGDFEEVVEQDTALGGDDEAVSRHWGLKFLGAYAVRRLTVRRVKARIEAFAVSKHASDKPLKVERFEMAKKQLRASKKRRSMYIDELVWKSSLAIARKATASNAAGLVSTGVNAARDKARAASKRLGGSLTSYALNFTHSTASRGDVLTGSDAPYDSLEVVLHEGKHMSLPDLPKPSCYVKFRIGKDSAKASSPVASNSRNPHFNDYTVTLQPILETKLKIQVFAKRVFAQDLQIGGRLDISLDALPSDGSTHTAWFALPRAESVPPPRDDDGVSETTQEKGPALRLSLRLRRRG